MKIYEVIPLAALASFAVIGLFSATHFRPLVISRDAKYYDSHEKRLLRLPGLWLTASMWLNYLNNLMVALGVIGTIIVLHLTVQDPGDIARIQGYTVLSFACSSLANFSNGKEKSIAYRQAYIYYEPLCTRYEISYGRAGAPKDEERTRRLEELADKRMVAEEIIALKHERPRVG